LEPAWVGGILVAAEAAALRQLIVCFRAPGRYPDRRPDVERSIQDGYSYGLTAKLALVIRRVTELRQPAHETEDGEVEAEPIEDVLARADLFEECEQLTDALEVATAARTACRRCRSMQLAQGFALIPVILLLPVPLWPAIADAYLLRGGWLHVASTLLVVAAAAVLALFALAIRADNELDKALVAQAPRRERIGA